MSLAMLSEKTNNFRPKKLIIAQKPVATKNGNSRVSKNGENNFNAIQLINTLNPKVQVYNITNRHELATRCDR